MYKLRYYQTEASNIGIKNLTKNNPQPFVLQLATGAGKSLIIADMASKLDGKVLVLQPSKELVVQNHSKMISYEPDFEVGIYSASAGSKIIGKVTYATIGSIVKKPELFMDIKYVIMDECHLLNPGNEDGMYTKFFKAIDCNRVCGLTATPYRAKQRFYYDDGQKYYTAQLAMINRIHPFFFKSIAYKLETQELIDKGFLCPILYRHVNLGYMGDLEINKTGSEYTEESIEKFWKSDERLEKLASVIQMIDSKCQRNLIFCSSILQAKRAREMLCEMGISAEMVTGSTSDKERDRLVQDYRDGKFKHMLNVGVFTTGFDVPELDSVVLARPTISLSLYYQMVGRGVRLDPSRPEKKLRVFDVVQVTRKLGRVETIKVQKEVDPKTGKKTWMDEVVSEAGRMTNVPLFTYAVNDKE